jgi:hypothetical protein
MLGRLIVGALIGLVLGAAMAAALIKGLGVVAFGAVLAYVFAAVVGVLTGLFAGKPIWAAGGQIEAGLKAFAGALLAAGAMFVIRQWVHVSVDLSSFGAGAGELGALPAASLPLIAAVLGAVFGTDNTPDAPTDEKRAASSPPVRVAKGDVAAALDEEQEPPAASRRARR